MNRWNRISKFCASTSLLALCLLIIFTETTTAAPNDSPASASASTTASAQASAPAQAQGGENTTQEQPKGQGSGNNSNQSQSKEQKGSALGCEPKCDHGENVGSLAIGVAIAIFVAGLALTKASLKGSKWSLQEALSEKSVLAPISTGDDADAKAKANPEDGRLVASSSRLMAFLGSLAMLAVFFGFGLDILWAMATGTGKDLAEEVKAVGSFLLYGAALFTPYAFNQVKDAFK